MLLQKVVAMSRAEGLGDVVGIDVATPKAEGVSVRGVEAVVVIFNCIARALLDASRRRL